MPAASEDFLGEMHQAVARAITDLIHSEDPEESQRGLQMALRFLKDNSITASPANEGIGSLKKEIRDKLPTAEELDRLMRLTPADLQADT